MIKNRKLYPALGLVICLAAFLVGCTYTYRVIIWNTGDIGDYKKFPKRVMKNSEPVFYFADKTKSGKFQKLFPKAVYQYHGKTYTKDWDEFLESMGTTSFLVIKDDALLFERYYNGYTRDSINVSFSVAKSFTSALVGMAIDEGLIKSINDPVVRYLPELVGTNFDNVTIRNLLMMNAGIRWRDGNVPWWDDPMHYYHPKLRKKTLGLRKFESRPGERFHYNSYNALLMGIVLERVAGMTVTEWTEKKLWTQIGMEYSGSWSIDSIKGGFEKTGSSVNARSIDFAKFGRLFLRKGDWDGKRVLSEDWIMESTSRDRAVESANYYKSHKELYKDPNYYYKYFWWGYSVGGDDYDFTGDGFRGQYIYVSPRANTIIVRNGKKVGKINLWPAFLKTMADKLED